MRRGEELDDRIPDLEAEIEHRFGEVTGREVVDGHELYVIDEPENPVFERVRVGKAAYSGKKDRLAVDFEERDPADLGPDELEAAGGAVDLKNEFLLDATGRDAKSRRDSMKRKVEDDAPDV